MTKKRDNNYYLDRLKIRNPSIYADYLAGRYNSPREAFIAAGIRKPRSSLQILQSEWLKLTSAERRKFEAWVNIQTTGTGAGHAHTTLATDGHLEHWAKNRILEIMDRRQLSPGDVMEEMGFKRLNASLQGAIKRSTRINPALERALIKWIADNAAV